MPEQLPRHIAPEPFHEKHESDIGQDKVQKLTRGEHPPRYETVPELPGLSRKLFFANPFSLYEDPINANDDIDGKLMNRVPAVYTVLNYALKGKLAELGDEEGNSIGWVDVKESLAEEWNLPVVLIPIGGGITNSVKLYPDRSTKASAQSVSMSSSNRFPVFELPAEGTYKIGPDISPEAKNKEITKSVWVNVRDPRLRLIADTAFVLNEEKIRKFIIKNKFLIEQFRLLPTAKRRGEEGRKLLHLLQKSYLQLLSISPECLQKQRAIPVVSIDVLQIDFADIRRMHAKSFKQWIDRLIGITRMAESALWHSSPRIKINIDGKDTTLYEIQLN